MKDVLPTIEQWRARGERVAIATVVKTLGSAPRGVGAKMAVSEGGSMAGSVSGGCIEGAVFDACQTALKTGQAPAALRRRRRRRLGRRPGMRWDDRCVRRAARLV